MFPATQKFLKYIKTLAMIGQICKWIYHRAAIKKTSNTTYKHAYHI